MLSSLESAMLEVRGLRKTYGELVAVREVSFSLGAGEVLGLLGPNGAGKTTTVSMISGLVTPDAGQVLIGGAPLAGDTDPKKRRIGLVPQDLALYDELSALANLRFFGVALRPESAPRSTTPLRRRSAGRPRPTARATASARSAAA